MARLLSDPCPSKLSLSSSLLSHDVNCFISCCALRHVVRARDNLREFLGQLVALRAYQDGLVCPRGLSIDHNEALSTDPARRGIRRVGEIPFPVARHPIAYPRFRRRCRTMAFPINIRSRSCPGMITKKG